MHVLQQDRQTGKTRACIEWLHNNHDGVLIVGTALMAEYVVRAYIDLYAPSDPEERYSLDRTLRDRIVSAGSRIDRLRGRKVKLAIDELDVVLRVLLGADVELATLTPQ